MSPRELAQTLATSLLRPGVVLSRIWLADDAGLALAGSAGAPTGGGSYARLDGQFSRIPTGAGKIGQIAATGQPLLVRSIRGDEDWLANPGWIARQGVRAFLGYPLTIADDVVGVLAVFDRATPSDEVTGETQFVAEYAAARLSDLRARTSLLTIPTDDGRPADARVAIAAPDPDAPPPTRRIVTRADLRVLEKHAIEAALAESRGRVFGPRGAAVLLGMKPTTLASRIKALGIA